ncbi:hypothetical protein NYO98_10525 [Nocardioides sp. STR2]|uniref:ANTAR domain-containing protein n=1 Tax=Nocardioides pini TaxID=2975053 RepID=A0ABT4CCL6_9ACTN|nr:hypothetical protein [Nocardioides pini]MCY4726713.1 hypothetical protein [Nocardioides pini]
MSEQHPTEADVTTYAAFAEVAADLAMRTGHDVESMAAIMRDLSERDAYVRATTLREAAAEIPDAWAAGWLIDAADKVDDPAETDAP